MAISLTNAKAIAALDAALSGAVELILYSGTVPADADTALSGNSEVATCVISNVAGAVDNTGSAQATLTVSSDTNTTGGTATFFRIENSSNVVLLQGSVGTSGENLNLNDVAIPAGATLSVSSFTISMPELGS